MSRTNCVPHISSRTKDRTHDTTGSLIPARFVRTERHTRTHNTAVTWRTRLSLPSTRFPRLRTPPLGLGSAMQATTLRFLASAYLVFLIPSVHRFTSAPPRYSPTATLYACFGTYRAWHIPPTHVRQPGQPCPWPYVYTSLLHRREQPWQSRDSAWSDSTDKAWPDSAIRGHALITSSPHFTSAAGSAHVVAHMSME
jgi:hypothetical protein